ncbi:hypothetical protein Ae168Ps1_6253c [Pseudonocardia sp. Ae168_Ps1]|uniref:hypothetical protein n=1 Tax=unclassified Pseudonocardia TaxID=2619320 RepID=UPI00095E7FD2|nr:MULTISPECIES: hypothetical protein [unclassified Pseudonocardia]OLL70506.1 hypothetical protein Ae168Ps1_6253c [Pseudonocardia sp. Ae168_Ps1]OLL71527.1 hypothetical protein Ae263Ps1_6015c [Pseudonocardia sp. Ae263_Ps1]
MARPYLRSDSHRSGSRGTALVILGAVTVLVLVLIIGLVVSLSGLFGGDSSGSTSDDDGAASVAPQAPGQEGSGPQAEAALARAPMLELPAQAVLPHALSSRSAGAPIALPAPQQVTGVLVPTGFDDTPEGAIAQAVELTRTGAAGMDPQVWAQAYTSLAEPGAAAPDQTPAGRDMVGFRRSANMPRTGPREGMTISWAPTSAMVKGSTDDSRYTVVCVLGELVTDYKGRVASGGWGNCLPLRRVGDQWRVASGPAARVAPAAWPGSDEAVAAGYRDITR